MQEAKLRDPLRLALAVITAVFCETVRILSLFWAVGTYWQAILMTIILAFAVGSAGYIIFKTARRAP